MMRAMLRRRLPLIAALVLCTSLGGIVAHTLARTPSGQPAAHPGKTTYDQYCAACHGPGGAGDGPSGAALPIKPSNLTDGRVMNPLPHEFMVSVIKDGGQAVGLSPLMPAWKDHLGADQIERVIGYVRSLANPPFKPETMLRGPMYPPEAPVQPILFSHLIHAGSFRIDCQYCHADARRSKHAGLPSVERCMGCHKIIGAQGNPEIAKVHEYWNRKEPIPWVRVFKVQEFVYFPHKAHVRAEIACQTCHGPIEGMMRVGGERGQTGINDLMNLVGMSPAAPRMTMGWCIECHREQNRTRNMQAPLDCVTCHH
jgi:mono/diheme cytochrome c family protein